MFTDVQVRGDYPVYMRKEFERRGFEIPFRENDAEILQKNLVDFVSFSHYSTRVAEADSEGKYESNLLKSAENPYLEREPWGRFLDPLGLRITMNEIFDRYQKPLFIVENGLGAEDIPDENGYVSYGVSADLAFSATECARKIIAQINPCMPFSYGDPVIHVSKIDAAVLVEDPLVEVPTPEPNANEIAIGRAIAERIPDGATLQIGVGGIPNAVIAALSDHKHLGLHTEAMTDGVLPLIQKGVIDNSLKKIEPGKSVACLALGSRHLYDLMDHNKEMIFRDVAWTNDPFIIGHNPRVMAINSCLEIDLTGQVCADSIGTRIFSGIGGQHDFVYGSSRSEGGLSFMAMTSTTNKGMGKIKPVLTPGAGVVTTRFQTNWVVTEHGAVNLRGKSLPERARLMISIANPADREELERAAFERFGYSFSRLAGI